MSYLRKEMPREQKQRTKLYQEYEGILIVK